MHDPTPSCFLGGAGGLPPYRAGSSPSLRTSVYETHMGIAELTWSRAVLSLYLHADIHLPSTEGPNLSSPFRFRLRPWLLWKRRGTRRFHVTDDDQHPRTIDFAWDLSRAAFSGGRPEPYSRFYLAVAVDSEIFLIVGDPDDPWKIHRKIKASTPLSHLVQSMPISSKEQVFAPDSAVLRPYTTWVTVGGKERRVSIEMDPSMRESRLCVDIDGSRVLLIKRLRWKFRGNERVEIEGKLKVSISWNVHQWLFPNDSAGPGGKEAGSEQGQAMFMFRFEDEEGRFGKNLWGCRGTERNFGVGMKAGRLVKTSSSMSASSTASTVSNASVMEWASVEENELKDSDGFTLMVCFSKR